jgi:hypothetical protein
MRKVPIKRSEVAVNENLEAISWEFFSVYF